MSKTAAKYYVVGLTHIDLAWKMNRDEHCEILEAAMVRLLDVLDTHPAYTYLLEQAAHFRILSQRRPDLIARLRDYVQQGRIEFAGGLASTLETNGPSGESFVRNQLLGLRCVQELFGVTANTGYLIDTFGVNAQVPQILRQFGQNNLLANRFGGTLHRDVFIARGLDGSRILVAGRDANSPYVVPERVFFGMTERYRQIDALFEQAATKGVDGPVLVMPYTEYDGIASTHIATLVNDRNASRSDGNWAFATITDFFDALAAHDAEWPEYDSDLNPEFTGTFGQRVAIRCHHRKAESSLLEAEKWATLLGVTGWRETAVESWWKMAFAESHDVYSGSHPTSVYDDTIAQLGEVEVGAADLLQRCAERLAGDDGTGKLTCIAMNGLPWSRDALVKVVLPTKVDAASVIGVRDKDNELPFEIDGDVLMFRTMFSGAEAKRIVIDCADSKAKVKPAPTAPASPNEPPKQASISNEHLTVTASAKNGLQIKMAGANGEASRVIGAEIVLQKDLGSFQIEDLGGAEVSSHAGIPELEGPFISLLRQRLIIRGRFPSLWTNAPNPLEWEMECSLQSGKPGLDLAVRINWSGETSRVRLKVTTGFESSTGIFEIPFGAVRRMPYHSRRTARGEWPVHRWVAVEEGNSGVALANSGLVGAEIAGGAIWTTLLRAPTVEYAGMVTDESSSQHGQHTFDFCLLPYRGSWTDGQAIEMGQELNTPVRCHVVPTGPLVQEGPYLTLAPTNVVLSGIKSPEDGAADEMIVRVYEASGKQTQANLYLLGAQSAWQSDLRETKGAAVECHDERISVTLAPFEIKTLRVRRDHKL
ncbi:glycosyl hydrolase-related protein [Devosia algicola]|uniref:Glycosyl hydrolase-related protein n=1 Tax=Devosia algicola TaxID=3026418 RepID=A0ABY7YMF1_9HYPH|nr:glycosyl hydrolase-related protein [Devosia algicola]WDR02404.1 glycosyl hydrolase-related protein [Devosia algicola]